MPKIIYKTMDYRGRITVPYEFRKKFGLNPNDIIRLEAEDDMLRVQLTKMDVVDIRSQNPEVIESYIFAAVKALPRDKKLAPATELLSAINPKEA